MAALMRHVLQPSALEKRPFSSRSSPPTSIEKGITAERASEGPSSHAEYAPVVQQSQEEERPVRMPAGSWDSHMHIVDPERYPLSPTAVYQPSKHTIAQAVAFENAVGASHVVIVQPSIYRYDNSCLLDSLRALGPSIARGVVAFDPQTITRAVLQDWHDIGVRGVRVNLQSISQTMSRGEMEPLLRRYADLVRRLGWVIQVYIPLEMAKALEHIIPELGDVRLCIDHMGSPRLSSAKSSPDPYSLDGFSSLVRLLKAGKTWIKMSAPYRFSKQDDYSGDVEPIAKELLRVAPNRVLFATDWPHTRFEGLDIRPWIERVLGWCHGDGDLANKIFKTNAAQLWA